METRYKIIKSITNNVVKARDQNGKEVMLTGKGIGFKRSKNDTVFSKSVENLFVLEDDREQQFYNDLIRNISPKIVDFSSDLISYIQSKTNRKLGEHIHIALTDHIAFLVRRCKLGITIDNPNMLETEFLYPEETKIAKEVVKKISKELQINIPEGESSFICLHIVSAISNTTMGDTKKLTALLNKLTSIIEERIMAPVDVSSLNYARLVSHIQFLVGRTKRNEMFQMPVEIEATIQKNYPQCCKLAAKMVKVIEEELKTNVDKNEVTYLALHLYRFGAEFG